jgi:L-arabinose isomerase
MREVDDEFLTKGLQLLIDGTDPDQIREVMLIELDTLEKSHKLGANILSFMGEAAPAFGMIGTLIGLVAMLKNLEDPSQIGAGMALALLTTLYGAFFANLFFTPMQGKLEQRGLETEVEEIEEAFHRVTEEQLEDMYRQFRTLYEVDKTVTNDHLRFSAQLAIAYDEVIRKHDISAFVYYWWGEKELITQLRAQSNLAVSRLAALGRPGVTEGDVKSAMAVKIMDLLGAGGMFVEFFSMNFDEEFILMGHDGPSNINMAEGRPRLQHLEVHHGKSGHGLGIDFNMREGPVTLLNLTQFNAGDTFKLVYSVGEIVPGPILSIGNPNCRVRVSRPIHEFMDAWCQQGPSHHIALGYGDRSRELEIFSDAMNFYIERI